LNAEWELQVVSLRAPMTVLVLHWDKSPFATCEAMVHPSPFTLNLIPVSIHHEYDASPGRWSR